MNSDRNDRNLKLLTQNCGYYRTQRNTSVYNKLNFYRNTVHMLIGLAATRRFLNFIHLNI